MSARAHYVKAARKDNPVAKKGEPYYWWAFRFGPKRYSKTAPKPSQLTQSEFLSRVYEIGERIAELPADDSLPDAIEEIVGELNDLADEQDDKKSNMPDGLQDGDTGQLLESRGEACRDWATELEGIDFAEFDEEDATADAKEELGDDATEDEIADAVETKRGEHWSTLLDEAQQHDYQGE